MVRAAMKEDPVTVQRRRQRKSFALTTFRSTFAGTSIDLIFLGLHYFEMANLKRNFKQGAPTKETVNAHQ